jgi:hypothetical protein
MKNNSNTSEFYSKAITSMPYIFSSHKFLSKLRKTGIRKEEIKSDYHLSFLLNNSERINKFLWRKKEVQIEMPLKVKDVIKPVHLNVSQIVKPESINPAPVKAELSDEDMINILVSKGYIRPSRTDEELITILKGKGYKVLKPTWSEL